MEEAKITAKIGPVVVQDSRSRNYSASSALNLTLSIVSLVAAISWLISRAFVGLDFTDEMQYYGEIASLMRTGKFFQDDLFIQQLGYVFFYPFLKLHAQFFPDQSYLVLYSRILLLSGYGLIGWLFWRSTSRLGQFSTASKIIALAVFMAWIPFQIFSPSYNSISYLLIVGFLAVWIRRNRSGYLSYIATASAFLAALTFTYPPAGLVLIAITVFEAAWRRNLKQTCGIVLFTVLWGAVIGTFILSIHGGGFFEDLVNAVRFSRTFGVARYILMPKQLAGLLLLLGACSVFIVRMQYGAALNQLYGLGAHPRGRLAVLTTLLAVATSLVMMNDERGTEYFPTAGVLLLAMLYVTSIVAPAGSAASTTPPMLMRFVVPIVLVGGLLTLLSQSLGWPTGDFAATLFAALLIIVAPLADRSTEKPLADLAIVGTILGAVFAVTSGNGLHNFGVGVAAVIPFLLLYSSHHLTVRKSSFIPNFARTAILPALVSLLVINGIFHPYREERGFSGFKRVNDVPAFAGLWVSPTKLEAMRLFAKLTPAGGLKGKRLLVAAPQPWFYFLSGGIPATPMIFMHFTGGKVQHEMLAERLFLNGEPDIILLAHRIPPKVQQKLIKWAERGCDISTLRFSHDFLLRYQILTQNQLLEEVTLFRRHPQSKEQPSTIR